MSPNHIQTATTFPMVHKLYRCLAMWKDTQLFYM